MRFPRDVSITFWEKVTKLEHCWEWKNFVTKDGYGLVRFKGKMVRAHRVSYFLSNGKMPTSWVLHRCDNRKCVNPDHLYEGTREDNIRDMVARNRQPNINKTHCPTGHEYSQENTRVYLNKRICSVCDRNRRKKVWAV